MRRSARTKAGFRRRRRRAGAWDYGRELRNFIECIREKRTPESDLELALDVTLTIHAGYVSAEGRGRKVEVPGI